MKILSYAWYIYDSRLQQYTHNCTGGGLVVRDLCEFLGRKEDSYLFIGQYIFPEMKLGNINIVKTDYNPGMKKGEGKDNGYISYMAHMFRKAVDDIQPDIIHFHDSGDLAYEIIDKICIPQNLKYLVTCHLYIGKNPQFAGYENSLLIEKRMMGIQDLNLVTVSSGMKKKILRDYTGYNEKSITPILNGTDFKAVDVPSDYREQLGVGNRKILLCAGTICYRKNQLQILNVFNKYQELQEKIFVIFCGKIARALKEDFDEEIGKRGLRECMRYVGALTSEEMKKVYTITSGLIMTSYAEGLSISVLEAITYGLPIIMFSDSECALDLTDRRVVCFAKNYTDSSLAAAIDTWYNESWNKEYIQEYSKYFMMERMADDYLRYYKRLIPNNIN